MRITKAQINALAATLEHEIAQIIQSGNNLAYEFERSFVDKLLEKPEMSLLKEFRSEVGISSQNFASFLRKRYPEEGKNPYKVKITYGIRREIVGKLTILAIDAISVEELTQRLKDAYSQ